MNTLLKVGLSAAWCLTALLATAIAIEITFGAPRPGFVPVPTLMLAVPVLFAIWKRPASQTVLRSAWTSGAIVAVIALVAFSRINWERVSGTVAAHNAPEPPRSTGAQALPPIPTNDGYPYGSYICMTHMAVKGERPVLTVRPQELRREFAENELAAGEKYKCRAVQTTGEVDAIQRDRGGAAYLSLSYGSANEVVFAAFDRANESPLGQLRRGQDVKVRCVVDPDSEFTGVRFHNSLHLFGCVILEGNGAKSAPDSAVR